MIKMAIYIIYCHLDLLEIFTCWPFDLISEGLTFYVALENLWAGRVTPVPPSSDAPDNDPTCKHYIGCHLGHNHIQSMFPTSVSFTDIYTPLHGHNQVYSCNKTNMAYIRVRWGISLGAVTRT